MLVGELLPREVPVGELLGFGVLVGDALPPALPARTRFVRDAVQVTVAPPPLPEPLHWSIVTGIAALLVDDVTVHCTRRVAPPPLPEELHWLMAALVVLFLGAQSVVGLAPPPVPEPMHCLMLACCVVAVPTMLLVTRTVHATAVVSAVDDDVVVVHVGGALAAPWQTLTVALELVFPLARLRLLTTTTEQVTPWPPTFARPLH